MIWEVSKTDSKTTVVVVLTLLAAVVAREDGGARSVLGGRGHGVGEREGSQGGEDDGGELHVDGSKSCVIGLKVDVMLKECVDKESQGTRVGRCYIC